MSSEAVQAILDGRDAEPLTYLTIIESHASPDILPTLEEVLQDAELTQAIGWDLVQILLPIEGSEKCLQTIARLGNPREVVLKVNEALQLLRMEQDIDAEEGGDEAELALRPDDSVQAPIRADVEEAATNFEDGLSKGVEGISIKPKETLKKPVDKFCTLVSLLATLHPRIKTKYPSRFLSSTLMTILAAYRPDNQQTMAVISFLHAISGKKRPALPIRKSSTTMQSMRLDDNQTTAPDPEAQEEDPKEAAIQKKLLQSFVTHIMEEYVRKNEVEWSARLLEHFEPDKVVAGRKSFGQLYREDAQLLERDTLVGQLRALARDLGLLGCSFLFEAIDNAKSRANIEEKDDDRLPTSPDDIPLSVPGSLILFTSFVTAANLFGTNTELPPLSIFSDHAQLVQYFIGTDGPEHIGSESPSTIDAILALGLWLENSNKFVSGPLEDDDFLKYLQSISLLSANTPSPTLRFSAHSLVSAVLHAHPVDQIRLTFTCDTLEHCPYDNLKAEAVTWLKEELMTAAERNSENLFSSTVALSAAQPYLFPDMSGLVEASDEEAFHEINQTFPFLMAVANFLIFIGNDSYKGVVPTGMLTVVEEIFLGPLRKVQQRLAESLEGNGELHKKVGTVEAQQASSQIGLLGERLGMIAE